MRALSSCCWKSVISVPMCIELGSYCPYQCPNSWTNWEQTWRETLLQKNPEVLAINHIESHRYTVHVLLIRFKWNASNFCSILSLWRLSIAFTHVCQQMSPERCFQSNQSLSDDLLNWFSFRKLVFLITKMNTLANHMADFITHGTRLFIVLHGIIHSVYNSSFLFY